MILSVSLFSYNKFMDSTNSKEIDQLHNDITYAEEQLNAEAKDQILVIANCGSGSEKFSSKYSCSLYLEYLDGNVVDMEYRERVSRVEKSFSATTKQLCGYLSQQGFTGLGDKGDLYHCSIEVRPSNRDKVIDLFSDYSERDFL